MPPPDAPPPADLWALDYDPQAIGIPYASERGPCLEVCPPLDTLTGHAERVTRLAAAGEAPLFLDIETCGLGGAPLFLIGIAATETEGFRLRQFLARDYAEEAAVLEAFAGAAAARSVWVTFNGATFDLPYIRDRAGYLDVPLPEPARHDDVLPPARRRWRGKFDNCRLTTLEEGVCHRRRWGDIPGSEIPGVYHEFVREGNWGLLRPVLGHNALDILTMADLWLRLRGD